MLDGGLHVQPLQCRLFSCNDYVDVVSAAQAVVRHRKKGIGIRRKVHAHDVRLLVHNMVDEAGILMGEPVMVLAPNVGGKEIIQGGDRAWPGNISRHFEPTIWMKAS